MANVKQVRVNLKLTGPVHRGVVKAVKRHADATIQRFVAEAVAEKLARGGGFGLKICGHAWHEECDCAEVL